MENQLENLSFHDVFDAVSVALLLADQEGYIISANAAAEKLFGYDVDAINGIEVEMLIPEHYHFPRGQHQIHFSGTTRKHPVGRDKSVVAIGRDGRKIPMEISFSPVQTEGRPCVLITLLEASNHQDEEALRRDEAQLAGIMYGITERRTTKRESWRRQDDKDSVLSQQVAIQTATLIAHELNQPLAAVLAYSEVALHELTNLDCPEKLQRALNGCAEQVQRAGLVLHELLEFLHKGDVNRDLIAIPIDINELVQDTMAASQNDGFDGFNSALELVDDMPPVIGNRIQVQRILTNLIRNGVEAAREAGVAGITITIRVKRISESGMAQITVQDNGPGLGADVTSKIFDPFFTTKSHGIGMGLAVCRALAKANGGQLWADPTTGKGATFHFTLPFAP